MRPKARTGTGAKRKPGRPKRVGPTPTPRYEVLIACERALWELVRACAAREGIPMYKVVEEALATRVKWSLRKYHLSGDVPVRRVSTTELLRITRAFHEKQDADLF